MMNLGFASYHPLPCFLYYVGVMLLAMTLYHPIFLVTALVIVLCINYIQDKGRSIKSYGKMYLMMGIFMAVLNPLISHRGRTILFYLFDNPITLESCLYGVTMSLSLLTILCLFSSYNIVINADKFMYLFSRFIPNSTFVTMLAMRFVPLLKVRTEEIMTVQKSLGTGFDIGSVKDKAKNSTKVLSTLVSWSLEDSVSTAQAMRSKGYGINRKRTFYFKYQMERRDYILLLAVLCLGAVSFLTWQSGFFVYKIYPEASKITVDFRTAISYIIFVVYMSLPIIAEGADRIKWL